MIANSDIHRQYRIDRGRVRLNTHLAMEIDATAIGIRKLFSMARDRYLPDE